MRSRCAEEWTARTSSCHDAWESSVSGSRSRRYGGSDADFTTLCIAIEELNVDSSMAITLEAGVGPGAAPIAEFGTAEQRERWLRISVRAERSPRSVSPSPARGAMPARPARARRPTAMSG